MWIWFGGLRKNLIGNFCESAGEDLHYIKAGNFLTFGGIIVEDTSQDTSQDMCGKEDDQRILSVYLSAGLDTSAVHFGLSCTVPTHIDILRMFHAAGLVL